MLEACWYFVRMTNFRNYFVLAADTVSLATWILLGKLLYGCDAVGFGEKQCGKHLPLQESAQMPHKPQTPAKGFFTDVAILAGFGIVCLVLWLVVLVILAGLIFLGLTAFTKWNFGVRVGFSLLSAYITMKVLSFISATLNLIPESWIDGKKKTKPCPECGKNLRTARAQ